MLLVASLVLAQGQMRDPARDSKNPHFKSMFVSLKGVLDEIRGPLRENGLVLVQRIEGMEVVTELLHVGGGIVSSRCPIICAKPNDPQAFGSAVTYARRYSAAAICGLAPSDEDDDGEGAMVRQPARPVMKPAAPQAAGFATVEFAVEALKSVISKPALDAWATKVKASGFMGVDEQLCRDAYAEKSRSLKEKL
jgi:hypothetical protein